MTTKLRNIVDRAPKIVKYSLVGLVAFATDWLIYEILLAFDVEYRIANGLVSRPLGGVVCFALNKVWTFENKGRDAARVQFLKFWCVFGVSWALSQLLLWSLVDKMEVDKHFAKPLAEGMIFVLNFFFLKLWTFR